MNLLHFISLDDKDNLQSALYWIAGTALFLYSAVLTISPAVRYHSWQVAYRWEHWIGFFVWILSSIVINKVSQKKLTNRDPFLLPIVALLVGIGLLTIFRLNVNFGWRQSIWFFLSTIMILIGLINNSWFKRISYYKYIWLTLGLLLTALTFILGIYPSGSGPQLWLSLGGIFIQPSEPLKILLVIYLSAYLAEQWPARKKFPTLIVPTIVMFVATLLILIGQKDLGTASLFITMYAFYVFLITGKRRALILFAGILLLAGLVGYQYFGVIRIRVSSWINPWLDPGGNSYQVIQSLQAIAAGKLIGSGPGMGSPGLVPVALSDFIFSAISEELGFMGAIVIFSLYAFLAFRGILIAISARNQYQRLLAAGITVLISIQAVLILGGNTRLLPLTGVTLPFISYGGSSLLTSIFAILLLVWVSEESTARSISMQESNIYLFTQSLILLSFFALSLITAWWGIFRSEALLSRTDNLRNIINDRYVQRGAILDRGNRPLAETNGEPGSYSRLLIDPSLSATIGYIDPYYGLGGLELSMDGYLRGLQGEPSSQVLYSNLFYNQPPQGIDVRTSLDLEIQKGMESALQDYSGGAILMNADTGEILALWTSPTFDANHLTDNWENWMKDPKSPLVNRVTQGSYQSGTLLTPFILAYNGISGGNLPLPAAISRCAITIDNPPQPNIGLLMQNGCFEGLEASLNVLDAASIESFLATFGWTENPPFVLPLGNSINEIKGLTTNNMDEKVLLSPFQVARAAAIFSNPSKIPFPRLAISVNTPHQGWLILAADQSKSILDTNKVTTIAQELTSSNFPGWEFVSSSGSASGDSSWFVSGTLPDWKSTSFVFVLALEQTDAITTQQLGSQLMTDFILNSTK